MRAAVTCPNVFRFAVSSLVGPMLLAGGLEVYISNQSSQGPITVILGEASAAKGDVLAGIFCEPSQKEMKAPTPLKGSARTQVLKPGQTAKIILANPPAEGQAAERRAFTVTQQGQSGECHFTYCVSREQGQVAGEVELAAGACDSELEKVDPDILIFWGFKQPEG